MIINDLATSGALPTLEKMFLFAGQRQRIIAHNIANINTPGFQTLDVDPKSFQKLLGDAIESRRSKNGGASGSLRIEESGSVKFRDGRLTLTPAPVSAGVLGHDRNNTDLERLMQQLVENATTFRVAADLMRKNKSQLTLAIAQRVL